MNGSDALLLVFGRDPQPGRVKTRLIPTLGAQGAAHLYRRLLMDTLRLASELPGIGVELWLDGELSDPALLELSQRHRIAVRQQPDGDLGERMHHALQSALQCSARAVLIGSDCPEYHPAYLQTAFAALSTHDAVLGPAADGGYVLIGLRHADAGLFSGVPWGDDQVLAQTRVRLRQRNRSWRELATLHDVDVAADLLRFPRLMRDTGSTN